MIFLCCITRVYNQRALWLFIKTTEVINTEVCAYYVTCEKPQQENLACKKKNSLWNFLKLQKSINKFFKWFNPRKFHSFESKSFLRGVGRVGRVGRVARRLVYRSGRKLPSFAKTVMFPINFTYKWTICCCCCCFFSFDNYFKPIKSQNSAICLHAVQAKPVTCSLYPFNENLAQHLTYRCFHSLFLPVLSNFEKGSNYSALYTQSRYCSRYFSTFRRKKPNTHYTSPMNHISWIVFPGSKL